MNLQDWLKAQKLSHDEFAEMLAAEGVPTTMHAVGKWVRGERVPRSQAMLTIQRLTNGDVTPADFYQPQQAAQ